MGILAKSRGAVQGPNPVPSIAGDCRICLLSQLPFPLSYTIRSEQYSSLFGLRLGAKRTDGEVHQQSKEPDPEQQLHEAKETHASARRLARSRIAFIRATSAAISAIPRTGMWRCPFERQDAGGVRAEGRILCGRGCIAVQGNL
jgi:hypothetical protein